MQPSPWHLKQAVRALNAGGVIAYPTEAVWGLGCDPFDSKAVYRLLRLKHRPVAKGLILVAADVSQLGPLLHYLSAAEQRLLASPQPQPTTWLLPDEHDLIPHWIKGYNPDVAVRVSTHSGVKALCKGFDGLLVSTSANVSSQPPARSRADIKRYFAGQLDYVLPGQLGGYAQPSEIRALRSGRVYRPGH